RGRGRLVLRVGMAARVVGVVRAGRAVVPGSAGLMVMVARAEPVVPVGPAALGGWGTRIRALVLVPAAGAVPVVMRGPGVVVGGWWRCGRGRSGW
ncbi:hypothetical protein, partial [Mycobacterium szulgai]|uniref:hypothetical protein n=1 Tax=Mycobacterium szulgai TaxID=1787 RepID=UPI0021F27109